MTEAAIRALIATNDSVSMPPYPIIRTWLSLPIIFGVVPEAINAWNPDNAPQAIVMNTNGNSFPANTGPYRLITTLLDHNEAPAAQLAAAYAQRWEIETSFDELKTHQRGPRTVLRSKSPKLVTQEIWGHLCCHYAIRTLMLDAAQAAGRDPDRVSFVAALRITRQTIAHPGAFPP